MPLAYDFFLHFAYVILFLWVMGEQLGVPVPSLPLLLAAGTLTATHKLSFPLVLLRWWRLLCQRYPLVPFGQAFWRHHGETGMPALF
jgi:hypothetical protein